MLWFVLVLVAVLVAVLAVHERVVLIYCLFVEIVVWIKGWKGKVSFKDCKVLWKGCENG